MSEAALLRPGIATGSYPERADVRESWLDRTTSAVFGTLYQRFGPNHLDRGFLRQVARASEGLERLATPERRLHRSPLFRAAWHGQHHVTQ